MEEYNIYRDIAQRNNGDVYIGVVGPVRTGKSTFIKKFMEMLILPNMEDSYKIERSRDELPQSAAGRTIMTTEPKFIPQEAVEISLGDNAHLKVRMIDCVGYIVNSSLGYNEDGNPRMVNTPWFEEPIPFNEAAEIGTKKVISEHSTVGLVVTTDGSITDIPREDYIESESRVINELKALNKPFVVLLNCVNPESDYAMQICEEIKEKHCVPVIAINCDRLDEEDIYNIIENVLFEFPLKEINISVPTWIEQLDMSHPLKENIYEAIVSKIANVSKVRHTRALADELCGCDFIKKAYIEGIDLGEGNVKLCVEIPTEIYYQILSESSGFQIKSDEDLMQLLCDLSKMKAEYDRIEFALHQVRETGYGVVYPSTEELSLCEPKMVKQGGKFGVKLRASAPSIHMIRADIETEVSPIVGSERQSEELVHYLLSEFENAPEKIWESNIFGKSLYELVNEGLNNKLSKMPEDARCKLRDTLEKIINEGSGGLICIIL